VLTTATTNTLGGVKVGVGVNISNDGTINVTTATPYVLNTASTNILGGVKIGTGIGISIDGTITVTTGSFALQTATTTILGGVKVDGSSILINGSGVISAPTTFASRTTASVTVSNLTARNATSATIAGFKSYALLSIETSTASWITIYSSTATQNSDFGRSISTDPTPGSGVIAEIISTQSGKILFTPVVIGFNSENTPNTNVPIKIYNVSTNTTASITVTLTLLKLEN
jgi:hypothetical protein